MKASLSWLNEYTPIKLDPATLVQALTMVGLEVDSVTDRFLHLKTVLAGQILEVKPHPKADRLTLCLVDIGQARIQVVCGAPNVISGILAPVALPGTLLDGETPLEKSTIRGEVSEGMLCSEKELGLGPDGSGILILSPGLTPGMPLTEALDLSDYTLDVDLTPNRPDCLSIIGIAREIAAAQKTLLTLPEIGCAELPDSAIKAKTSVTIQAPDHCPRYAARIIENITVAPSPYWLQDRLLSVGLRPINNIVDITNYVMMETGQPLHAFDFDLLSENRIVVRTAFQGETFQTLDNKDHTLTDDMLMICDGQRPVAIAGVMGGLNSEIRGNTRRVLLESACFSPTSVRKTAKRLGINTDASHRFERGVDPEGTVFAINRAALMMAEVCSGTLVEGFIDAHPGKKHIKAIELGVADTNRILGTSIHGDTAQILLESIGFQVSMKTPDKMEVLPPSFRVDIHRPIDLMEEIARLYGYDHIPTTFPRISPQSMKPETHRLWRNRIKTLMTGLGFSEAVNYSFVESRTSDLLNLPLKDVRRKSVKILNPLSEDQTEMRTMVLPGLLKNMHRNLSQQVNDLKLFEIAKVFINHDPMDLPEEIEVLTGLWTGSRNPLSWHDHRTLCDFYDMKGAVEGLFSALHLTRAGFKKIPKEDCVYTRPGYSATIEIGQRVVGLMGELHPSVLKSYALKQTAYIFEINMGILYPLIPETTEAILLPKYPWVQRDFTLIVDQQLESLEILENILRLKEPLVETVHLFDMFEGKQISPGKKSISFRIRYRSENRTLADEEINSVHKAIADKIISTFNAALPT
ncbi:MAG: phenylalanine--tRNA ligase subunit beta [Proteobacteria bacterium]|nr:phenylalanine--tRNA ligase subunit beta [Pseudomonadota bacterium]MBU4470075.1 phenylalanine--tRNA ligase subunit beta [Pseudomonadota bacterium]MCG2750720.1 phenylalanine--tRNA ligase subunit beta [Desulfobacteraceae bacterium]